MNEENLEGVKSHWFEVTQTKIHKLWFVVKSRHFFVLVKTLCRNTGPFRPSCIVCGHFCATTAELSSCVWKKIQSTEPKIVISWPFTEIVC